MADPEYRFQDAVKDPAETLLVSLNFFNLCANFWAPNEQFTASEFIRPVNATGFAYQASGSGTSGSREPRWPTTLGQTVVDGSIVWTCSAASSNGVNAVSVPSAVSDPTGLTIGGLSVSESTKILASYAGGIDGQDYDAVFSLTLNSVSRVARQRVRVRRR